uniref:Outer dense fiber protein 3 n=1 Tax=Clastoptera arizonana TaxID=38151 RepID=A0A1B6DHF6_9HEMI
MKGAPAPNAYKLPPAVGYKCHDSTKLRNPAYSIRQKLDDDINKPGPSLYNVRDKTRFGIAKSSAFTMTPQPHDIYIPRAPPPTTYSPQKCTANKPKAPMFTIGLPSDDAIEYKSPGPCRYTLPTTLGPKIPDKHCNGAFTLQGKPLDPRGEGHPAPNKYFHSNINTFKPTAPKYTIGTRTNLPEFKMQKPGPSRYNINQTHLQTRPGYSFGSRHSNNTGVYITNADLNTPLARTIK